MNRPLRAALPLLIAVALCPQRSLAETACSEPSSECAVVKKQGQPVSKVCRRFDPLPQVLRNVRCKSREPLESTEVRNAIRDAEARLDGHGRVIVRASGTEPVIRIMGEGDDRMLVEEVVDGIVDALTRAA